MHAARSRFLMKAIIAEDVEPPSADKAGERGFIRVMRGVGTDAPRGGSVDPAMCRADRI
jgi:hypothetical protein